MDTNDRKFLLAASHDEKIKMAAAMKRYGGGFVVALAECFIHADATNLQRLYTAFPEIIGYYCEIARDSVLTPVAGTCPCGSGLPASINGAFCAACFSDTK